MENWFKLHTKTARAILALLFFVTVFMTYMISQREGSVYHVPEATMQLIKIPKQHKPRQVSSKGIEYMNTTQSNFYSIQFITTYLTNRTSSNEPSLEIPFKKLIKKSQMKNVMRANSHLKKNNLQRNYPLAQKERIDRIRSTCKKFGLFRESLYHGKHKPVYYYSRRYDFLYCKVPKSGSTFWTQAFEILEHGAGVSDHIFGLQRSKVHDYTSRFKVKVKNTIYADKLTILVSRDPFSRLYSAFIDKSYLLMMAKVNFHIRNLNPKTDRRFCPIDVTFQEFLDFVLKSALHGETLDAHWTPIHNLCRPCDVNAFILVKQESFSEDVEDALKALDVEEGKLKIILSSLKEHRVESTIPGIIKTAYSKIRHNDVRSCIDGKGIALRLWNSFIIQGFIKKSLTFPTAQFKSKLQYENATYVTNVILRSIEKNKMTSSEAKEQRLKSLVEAYRDIRYETIELIKEVFKIDFELFHYSTYLPTS